MRCATATKSAPRILHELSQQLLTNVIDLFGIGAGHCIGILALVLTSDARADLQHRKWSKECKHPWYGIKLAHHLGRHFLYWLSLRGWPYESKRDSLVCCQETGGASHSEVSNDIWILMEGFVHPIL